jgi:hypothetical protein
MANHAWGGRTKTHSAASKRYYKAPVFCCTHGIDFYLHVVGVRSSKINKHCRTLPAISVGTGVPRTKKRIVFLLLHCKLILILISTLLILATADFPEMGCLHSTMKRSTSDSSEYTRHQQVCTNPKATKKYYF